MKCPACGTESRFHAPDCKLAAKLNERLKLEQYAKKLTSDPAEYRTFLTESIAAHLVKLDQQARNGDIKAAEAFRRGAIEIMEMIGAEKERGKTGGAAGGVSGYGEQGAGGSGAAAAIAAALGEASVELADGDGPGDGESPDSDEG